MVPAIQNLKKQFVTLIEKKFKILLITSLALLFALGIFNIFWTRHGGMTAYINTEQVYNNFDLKKKMESQLKMTEQIRQGMLDSMKLQLDLMYSHMQSKGEINDSFLVTSFGNLRDTYFKRQEEFRQANEALAQQYTSEIWSQLNQYLQDYGHKKGYQYIFGATGDGALMFADDAVNITDDVKGYVNDRYKGQP
jgi:outer membrane protein